MKGPKKPLNIKNKFILNQSIKINQNERLGLEKPKFNPTFIQGWSIDTVPGEFFIN